MSADMNEVVIIDGQEISLEQLAGVEIGGLEDLRFTRLPIGSFVFEVHELPDFTIVEIEEDGVKVKRTAVKVQLKVAQCIDYIRDKDDTSEKNPDQFVGKTHTENFLIKTTDDLRRFKTFVGDTGIVDLSSVSAMREIFQQMMGGLFIAQTRHSKSKTDPDKIYTNLRLDKIKPAEGNVSNAA